jgi:hypothetical protein
MIYSINVELQITNNRTIEQPNNRTTNHNGQDKKSESESPASTTRQRR